MPTADHSHGTCVALMKALAARGLVDSGSPGERAQGEVRP